MAGGGRAVFRTSNKNLRSGYNDSEVGPKMEPGGTPQPTGATADLSLCDETSHTWHVITFHRSQEPCVNEHLDHVFMKHLNSTRFNHLLPVWAWYKPLCSVLVSDKLSKSAIKLDFLCQISSPQVCLKTSLHCRSLRVVLAQSCWQPGVPQSLVLGPVLFVLSSLMLGNWNSKLCFWTTWVSFLFSET